MVNATKPSEVRTLDMKLEVIVIPVSNVERGQAILRRPRLEARRRFRLQ